MSLRQRIQAAFIMILIVSSLCSTVSCDRPDSTLERVHRISQQKSLGRQELVFLCAVVFSKQATNYQRARARGVLAKFADSNVLRFIVSNYLESCQDSQEFGTIVTELIALEASLASKTTGADEYPIPKELFGDGVYTQAGERISVVRAWQRRIGVTAH
jgi:hypothetical protein